MLCFCHIVDGLLAASPPWEVVSKSHLSMCAGLDHCSSHCLLGADRSFLGVGKCRFSYCIVS